MLNVQLAERWQAGTRMTNIVKVRFCAIHLMFVTVQYVLCMYVKFTYLCSFTMMDMIMTLPFSVHLMNANQRHVAADLCTKPVGFGHWSS